MACEHTRGYVTCNAVRPYSVGLLHLAHSCTYCSQLNSCSQSYFLAKHAHLFLMNSAITISGGPQMCTWCITPFQIAGLCSTPGTSVFFFFFLSEWGQDNGKQTGRTLGEQEFWDFLSGFFMRWQLKAGQKLPLNWRLAVEGSFHLRTSIWNLQAAVGKGFMWSQRCPGQAGFLDILGQEIKSFQNKFRRDSVF